MLRKLGLSVIIGWLLWGGVIHAQQSSDETLFRQWAVDAAATSEYNNTSWSALQATGAPDVEGCGDLPGAWASASPTGEETLTLYYDIPVQVRQINVYLNYNPGTITSVALLTPDGSPLVIPGSSHRDPTCPGIFSLDVPPAFAPDLFVNAIQITIDQTKTGVWTEIDAVELVGIAPPGSIPTSTSQSAVFDGPLGEQIYCDDVLLTENGVVVTVIQMRPNSNYIATVVGLNGFDPVLGVFDAATGSGLCNDDNADASYYQADLPTTGVVSPSNFTSSVTFNTFNYTEMADIELVVGGYNSQPGEFILILEGMVLSREDGAGDPLALTITPGMVLSGVDPTVYMLSVVGTLDPLIAMIDYDYNFIVDSNGDTVFCDDAGNTLYCWGESYDLRGSFVSRSQRRQLGGATTDAMLTMPITEDDIGLDYIAIMRSYEMQTFGDYVAIFHIGIGSLD